MGGLMRTAIFSLIFIFSVSSYSETPSNTTVLNTPDPDTGFSGSLDIRPEYNNAPKTFDLFYEVMLGHQFNSDLSLNYVQWFSTNLYDPFTENRGTNFLGDDGFIKFEANNLLKSGGFQVAYENRLVLPTNPDKAAAGMVLENQARIKLIEEWGKWNLTLIEIPVGHVYQNAAYVSSTGDLTANPGFSNYVYFFVDYAFTEKLLLSFPFLFESALNRKYDGAIDSGKWIHNLRIWPELTYAVTPKLKLGVAYYSGSVITTNVDRFLLDNFNADSQTQLIFQLTL